MGAYIYRLKGKRHYKELMVEGQKEKVYDLVYWYKPYFGGFWDEKEPQWMKPIRMLGARLRKMFKDIEVKYVQVVYEDRNTKQLQRADHIMEWNVRGDIAVYDDPDWNGMKRIKLS